MYLVTFTHERDGMPVTHLLLLTEDLERAVRFVLYDEASALVNAIGFGMSVHDLPPGPGPYGFHLHRIEPDTPMPLTFQHDTVGSVILHRWRNTFSDRNRLLVHIWYDQKLADRFGT